MIIHIDSCMVYGGDCLRHEMVEMRVTANAIWQHGRVTFIEGMVEPLSAPCNTVCIYAIVHGTEVYAATVVLPRVRIRTDALANT